MTTIIQGADNKFYVIFEGKISEVSIPGIPVSPACIGATGAVGTNTSPIIITINKQNDKCKEGKCIMGNLGRCVICEN
jgi:hypothetical protein